MIKPRETFHLNPTNQTNVDWMIKVTDLEVSNFIFNITTANKKLELYKFLDENIGGVSYTKVRNEIEKDLDISDITGSDLQDDILGPIIIDEHEEQVTKSMEAVGFMNILAGYPGSIFQNFERYLGTDIDLVGDDIRLVLDY